MPCISVFIKKSILQKVELDFNITFFFSNWLLVGVCCLGEAFNDSVKI